MRRDTERDAVRSLTGTSYESHIADDMTSL